MADPESPRELRTKIAQDLLGRSGVNTKSILELQPKPMSLFEQAILSASISSDIVMDLDDADDDTLMLTATAEDIEDAELVDEEGDEERYQREDERDQRAQ